jgi:ribosomal protein S18 acetylase RimI-like enzyme
VIELRVLTPGDWRAWRQLRLAVVPGNENAAALYRRNGFRLTGELGDLMPDGVSREHITAKDLSAGA